jgi:hypothetical protein
MAVSIHQIGWSSYDVYEGPFFRGTSRFTYPSSPTFSDQILAVITATEGGAWNAINMYDRCICTVGLIQWCEGGQYSVSDMLGMIYARDPKLLDPLTPMMRVSGVLFKRNARGNWRFHFVDARGEVDRVEEQRQLFLLNSTGRKGSWDDKSRNHACGWAAALASVFENQAAIAIQRDYTVPRLFGFALPFAKRHLDAAPQNDIGRAFTAAYLSFAANNPTKAEQALRVATQTWVGKSPYTQEWLVHVLERLTFHSGITIYPYRYNAIRPILESLFHLDLPDIAASLQGKLSSFEIQGILVRKLGYDLGTSGPLSDGVDGIWGAKSTRALLDFQRRNAIAGDGLPNVATNDALIKLRG